ncbi:MAG: N-acetylmuramoyl-L-alanine amidase [Peptococcaceae bacterium]|nr:N-acetylmuramoyl-L-alanine amidase [Peptococcaceae bacterium]
MVKVCIDPGHGGGDPGATGNGLEEKDVTLKIARYLRNYLNRKYKVSLLVTRTADETVTLPQRTKLANDAGCELFVSIHVNAGGGTGFESYIYPAAGSKTVRYRRIIHDEIAGYLRRLGITDRGKKTANFYVLRETRMSAVLLETLFIDRQEDVKWLKDETFLQNYAAAAGEGIAKALDLPVKDDDEKDKTIAELQAEVNRLRSALQAIKDRAAAALGS